MAAKVYQANLDVPKPKVFGERQWKLSGLQAITVLFGKNGSGKSLLLRAWHQSHVEASHYVVPERTGSLGFNPNFLQQQIDPKQRWEQSRQNFVNEYRQQVIARIQGYFVARGASREDRLPGNIEKIEQLVSALLPDFSVELLGANPPYKLVRTSNQVAVGDVHQLSSGEAQTLTLGLDILTIAAIWNVQNAKERVLLVDEPDAHLHPDLQSRFADFLVQVADQFDLQVIVATHSTTLLAAVGHFAGDRCAVIYLDRTRDSFAGTQFTEARRTLASCLGGHVLMGPLFGVPLLLVEGDDDYRIWSQVPRHHVVSFAVLPANGHEIYQYQKNLEQIFASLRERGQRAGYALVDGDKEIPTAGERPQDHVQFLRMACREAENLYLTDEVLASIGTDWEHASATIEASASKHGRKAEKLARATRWDRQQEDIKDVINEIASAIDKKAVHWTHRVGATIGKSKPTGQLAAFLGSTTVEALWPSGVGDGKA